MFRLVLPAFFTLTLCPFALADKFYFTTDEETAKEEEDSIPDVIEGVLIAEDEENYTIRVEGGEIQLAKDMVVKRESDSLTVADIEAAEQANAAALAQADEQRQQFLAVERAEAAARRDAAIAAEAAMIEAQMAVAAEAVLVPGVPPVLVEASYFDPVLDVPAGLGMWRDAAMLRELFFRYQERRDRDLARQMRQMRRYY